MHVFEKHLKHVNLTLTISIRIYICNKILVNDGNRCHDLFVIDSTYVLWTLQGCYLTDKLHTGIKNS